MSALPDTPRPGPAPGALSLRLTRAASLEDVELAVCEEGPAALGADDVGLASAEGGGWRLAGGARSGEVFRTGLAVVAHDSPLPVCRVARTGEVLVLADPAALAALEPAVRGALARTGRRAWVLLPLADGGEPVGALALAWDEERSPAPGELELLGAHAAQCAQALARVLAERERHTAALAVQGMAQALQRSLLTRPPVREGLDVAVRYRPAARDAEVGGDWFDAFTTRSGGTVLVVGDVSGHDQEAAGAMSQVRNLLRGIAYDGDDRPVELLARLDRVMAGLDLSALATAVLAEVAPPTAGVAGRTLRWANAGHVPPVLRRADGSVQRLASSDDLLLGLDTGCARHEHAVDLFPGDLVVLYTDGVVERRGADLDEGIAELARSLTGPDGRDAGSWADAVLDRAHGGPDDDAAVLVAHVAPVAPVAATPAADAGAGAGGRRGGAGGGAGDGAADGAGAVLDVTLPADPRCAHEARRLTRGCCHRAGLPEDVADTAVLLTSELVSNAILHGRSEARLRVRASAGDVHVEVSDDNDRLPVLQAPDDEALSGRGVGLLQAAATRWGARAAGLGKVVWFDLDAARTTDGAGAAAAGR
ncbi:ATP-binding SpoIIE family protein phosphatase [Kineococcus gypseus]|uniref:ATP-binding SpoIIE family protein phosphatase n=1 Tax=Kineococcus gypseus TaxID=1637102 RepID=UPI003D7DAEBF